MKHPKMPSSTTTNSPFSEFHSPVSSPGELAMAGGEIHPLSLRRLGDLRRGDGPGRPRVVELR